MVKPFVEFDLGKLKATTAEAVKALDNAGEKQIESFRQAMGEYSEDILAEAMQKAPMGKSGFSTSPGELKGSGTVVGPEIEGDAIVYYVAFNKVYARIQDLGGEIKPKRARALFIPLVPGVRPGQKGLIEGIDFVLAKRVVLKGNRYLTGTVTGRIPTAAEMIGKRATQLMEVA